MYVRVRVCEKEVEKDRRIRERKEIEECNDAKGAFKNRLNITRR